MPPKKGTISKPMQVMALRFTDEDRERLQRIADEYDVTLSWVIREGRSSTPTTLPRARRAPQYQGQHRWPTRELKHKRRRGSSA